MSTEKLIEMVYRYPELYDRNHRDFRKLQKKSRLWKAIASRLGRSNSSEQVKRRWKNLRDTYTRFLKSCAEENGGSKRWLWSERMEIFRPYVVLQPSSTEASAPQPEVPAGSEDSAHEEEAAQEPELRPGCPPTPPQQELITCDVQVNTEAPAVLKLETDRLSFQEHLPQPPTEEVYMPPVPKRRAVMDPTEPQTPVIAYLESRGGTDEIDSLFLAYAMTVKKFSPRRQALTKLKMAQLIAEEELAHVDETELLGNPSTLP